MTHEIKRLEIPETQGGLKADLDMRLAEHDQGHWNSVVLSTRRLALSNRLIMAYRSGRIVVAASPLAGEKRGAK